jgi:hypothetical protein
VLAAGPAHHQEVVYDRPAAGCMPGRLQHHRAWDVSALLRHHIPGRTKPELSGGPVKQRPEDARRVGAGQARPLDGAVRSDQAALLAVGQESIVRNSWNLVVISIDPNYASSTCRRHELLTGHAARRGTPVRLPDLACAGWSI